MHIVKDTLDDLLHTVFKKLLISRVHIKPSKGPATEIPGILLELTNPRARLSRTETKGTVFSCLGETLWYLAGSGQLSFIEYYIKHYKKFSDDGKTVFGAYGPRLLAKDGKINQIESVLHMLKVKPDTRQAVIQLFDAKDILKPRKDIPCTCTLQFMFRGGRLHLFTTMRSNDAYLGLPHDVFAFTLLQEIIARSIGADIGSYKHSVGSLHLYKTDRPKAHQYLKEAYQSPIQMPPMPTGDPWPNIKKLLSVEAEIRTKAKAATSIKPSGVYWNDLVRLLEIFSAKKRRAFVNKKRNEMHSQIFNVYIDKLIAKRKSKRKKVK